MPTSKNLFNDDSGASTFANKRNFFNDDGDEDDDNEVFVKKPGGGIRKPFRDVSSDTLLLNPAPSTSSNRAATASPAGSVDPNRSIALQQVKVFEQDKHIEQLGTTIGELREISENISTEVDEQVLLLEEFSDAMQSHHTRLQRVMNRIEKFSHLSSDRQQWIAIFALSIALILIVVLFIVL